mmetsp:Transcript_3094/g.4760  ORF Transcript_3094/g.4760 Transcript_3094/m.4760 type:complete len:402 (-) Transcript_3094:280-1485(-)
MSSTHHVGDMRNTWKVFSVSLRRIGVQLKHFISTKLKAGDPSECTRLLRVILLGISVEVAEQMISRGYGQLASDKKFINTVFRYLREQSKYFPVITIAQYHMKGFGEHKLLLISAAAGHVHTYLAAGGLRLDTPYSSKRGTEKRVKQSEQVYEREMSEDEYDSGEMNMSDPAQHEEQYRSRSHHSNSERELHVNETVYSNETLSDFNDPSSDAKNHIHTGKYYEEPIVDSNMMEDHPDKIQYSEDEPGLESLSVEPNDIDAHHIESKTRSFSTTNRRYWTEQVSAWQNTQHMPDVEDHRDNRSDSHHDSHYEHHVHIPHAENNLPHHRHRREPPQQVSTEREESAQNQSVKGEYITRAEVEMLMHDLEKRIRGEYEAAIYLLSNRVRFLEDERGLTQTQED